MKTLDEFLDEIEILGNELIKTRYGTHDEQHYLVFKAVKIIREMHRFSYESSMSLGEYTTLNKMISKILNEGDVE